MNLPHLSTSTPASEISSESFARNDGQGSSEADVPSMADILRNSPAAALLGMPTEESQPEDTEDALTQDDESEGTDPASEEESENTTESEETEAESTGEDDTESTQETADLPAEEDIDWEYKVPVKVDGKEQYLTLEEIRKGYATSQHLSNEGRKLGEQRKEIEREKAEKLQELIQVGTVLHDELTVAENELQKEYNDLSRAIEKAREEGDTYTARELKEKREEIQEKYWQTRNTREERTAAVTKQWVAQQEEAKQQALSSFNVKIKEVIPDFNANVAKNIRDFALKEGLTEEMLGAIYDANIVKFINDYRKLKTARESGEAKRKATPMSKSVPTKNGVPQSKREAQTTAANRQKVLSGNGTKNDELDFIKRISQVSRKL